MIEMGVDSERVPSAMVDKVLVRWSINMRHIPLLSICRWQDRVIGNQLPQVLMVSGRFRNVLPFPVGQMDIHPELESSERVGELIVLSVYIVDFHINHDFPVRTSCLSPDWGDSATLITPSMIIKKTPKHVLAAQTHWRRF
jgi:hypothetical protein